MKTVIFGDIHGRSCWRPILEKETPDRIIFLGDYVTTHEHYTPEQQKIELEAILDLKESRPESVIMLRGNHDLDGLGYPWARCYPSAFSVQGWMIPMKDRFLKDTQWVYEFQEEGKRVVCSHAGISEVWLREVLKMDRLDTEAINRMEPSHFFAFNGPSWDTYGEAPTQSCVWIRPTNLIQYAIPEVNQIVGHTHFYKHCAPVETKNHDYIWLCDAMANQSYLVIENGEYKSCIL